MTLPCKTDNQKKPAYTIAPGLEIQIRETVADFKREDWDGVVGSEKLFMQYDYIETLEQVAPSHISFRYAIICRNGRPVWVAYFQILRFNHEMLRDILKPIAHSKNYVGLLTGWHQWLTKESSERCIKVLISGNNYVSGEYGQSMTPDTNPEEAFMWLSEAIRILLRTERDERPISLVLVKDYYDALRTPSKKLRLSKYYEFLVEPEMIVTTDPAWQTFEDYLAAMSKKYRNRAKTTRSKMTEIKQENWDYDTLVANEDTIYALYDNVQKKANFRLAVLPVGYFSRMKKKFGDQFKLHVYIQDGIPIAFRSSFATENILEAHYIGIDYEVNKTLGLYQAILYDFVEEGISKRSKHIYFGRTASEIKSTVGAKAHHLTCYIRHRNPVSNQLIRPFLDYLKPSEWVPRNPFKEESV